MFRLSRKAFITIFIIAIAMLIGFGYALAPKREEPKKTTYSYEVLANDVSLKTKYLGIITAKKASTPYVQQEIKIHKDEKVAGYQVADDYHFTKIMQVKGPTNEKVGQRDATGVAYSLVAVGDIVRVKNNTTKKKTIQIRNARVVLNVIPVYALSDERLLITDSTKTKFKRVNKNDFNQALSSLSTHETMISW